MTIEPQKAKIGFITVGCRANQADTSGMITFLHEVAEEADPWSGKCGIVIINTCAVTMKAEADARKLIRRAKRANPSARVIVTGCAVQVDSEKWDSMPEVEEAIEINDRERIFEIIAEIQAVDLQYNEGNSFGINGPTPIYGQRSRPLLRIQDGCSRGCSYCIVPRARGPERSRRPELILDDINKLVDMRYREIVLSGVHLGRWGIDLGYSIRDLLELLNRISGEVRIRLSSIEPMDLTPGLVRDILSHPRICPHLHIPLQSGNRNILTLMGRGHSPEEYMELLTAAVGTNPDTSLGTDIMVGFPGETQMSHSDTVAFIRESPLTYLHIFSYSPRPGTRAYGMEGRPEGIEVKSRMRELKSLDREIRARFIQTQEGKIRDFLVEGYADESDSAEALSDNFIKFHIKDLILKSYTGQVIRCKIDINDDGINVPNPSGI